MAPSAPAIRDEILKCGKDPVYFIRTYVKIQHPVRGLIPFVTFDYQDKLLKNYVEHRFNVILKARQLGISEISAAYALWMMLFYRNKNILVMASKADTAKNIVKKVKVALKHLPDWLRIADEVTYNKLSVELSNGSQIKAITTSDDAGRSEALSLLIIDEAAFVKGLDVLWTGLLPTVTAGGNIIVLSTPNGVGNKFHQLYTDAEEGRSEFHPTKLMWWDHPERISDLEDDPERPGFKTSSWYRKEVKQSNMGPREVAQELESNFNASGDTFLSTEEIDWVREGTIDPTYKEHWDRNLFVWWPPEPNARYMISADVARGDGRDNSACVVWNTATMEECAEYYGKIPVEEFAGILMDLGKRYNKALLVVENNNIGMACLEHIRLAGYEAVYYSRKGDNKPGESVHSAWGASSDDLVIGFTMTSKVRPLIFSKMEEFIRKESTGIRSGRFVHEAKTFVWEAGKPQAMRGSNDDLICATAIGFWIKDTFISPGEMAAQIDAKLLESMKIFAHVNTEIHGASKNPDLQPQRSMGVFSSENHTVPTKIRIPGPGNKSINIGWLYK